MASRPDSTVPSNSHKARRRSPAGRITVYELFRRYAPLLAELPGETSQFDETGFGYEWRCEYRIAGGSDGLAGEHSLKLHFSLVDMKGRLKPVAVLYLVEQSEGASTQARQMLPLEDLAEAHEVLNAHLARKRASIGALERASGFISDLSGVREALEWEVDWDSTGD
jgi:hypothetical protein